MPPASRLPARVLARYLAEGEAARTKIWRAGMLTVFDDRLLPIDLAVGDWARWDETVAERLRRVDDKRLA